MTYISYSLRKNGLATTEDWLAELWHVIYYIYIYSVYVYNYKYNIFGLISHSLVSMERFIYIQTTHLAV